MTDNIKNKKLSMPNLNYNSRKSVLKNDSKFEFDAPKYYDFSKIDLVEEKRLYNENYIDPWFFIEHRKKPCEILRSSHLSTIQSTNQNIMNKSDKNKKRQSAITHENDKNQNKKLLNSNKTNENNISIDEMLKIHNEKVKKRKYSQYEKENISIDKNSNNADNSIQNNNKNTIDNKYSLSRPKKILAYSKRSLNVNNISKNLKTNQCSFVANTKNLCKNNDSNLNKNNTTSCNLINNSLLVSVKKNSNKTLNEDKTAMKTVHKKDINSFDTVKEKTNKKGPLRINRFDANLINLTNYNSSVNFNVKNLKRGFSTSNDNFKDNKSLKLKSIKVSNSVMSRNKSLTSTTVTYCPRLFSASVMKKWEKMKGLNWYNLSPSSRNTANQEITELLKNNNL